MLLFGGSGSTSLGEVYESEGGVGGSALPRHGILSKYLWQRSAMRARGTTALMRLALDCVPARNLATFHALAAAMIYARWELKTPTEVSTT
jgi:hypothetical protein